MTANRYRAGQPADLSHMLHRVIVCPYNGCNYPEGGCSGDCSLDSVDWHTPARLPIQFAGPEPEETPLRARVMDAAADAFDWVLDRLWVGSVVLVVAVGLLVWSLR